jgi:aubergine-like protein
VLKPGHIKDWFLIYLWKDKRDDQDADFLVDELKKNASKLGIKLENPYFILVRDENPNNWVNALKDEIKMGGKPQIIVSVIPEKSKDRLYPALKELCLN